MIFLGKTEMKLTLRDELLVASVGVEDSGEGGVVAEDQRSANRYLQRLAKIKDQEE